ncbi:MAG: TRAP transporter substrate-binding protein DctP [Pseudomonadota bacterium]|nr:TRAP transporter substrate-binding protein DctP [Pseudomonadota bacterium]
MIGKKIRMICVVILFASITVSRSTAADITMRIAFQAPKTHYSVQSVLFFKSQVEQRSNGKIQVKIHDYTSWLEEQEANHNKSEEKIKLFFFDKEIPIAISNGSLESGMASLSRFSEDVPLVDIFFQPFLFDTEKKVKLATDSKSVIRIAIEREIQNLGLTVLWWQPYGNVVFVSKGEPIRNPEAMRGKKVRVFSRTMGNLALSAGGFPVSISNSRQYFAYKHNKVDIGMTTILEIDRYKTWEVMDTISLSNSATIQFLIVVNTRWWNSLDFKLKTIISNAAEKAQKFANEKLKEMESNAFRKALENGMTLEVLSDDDRDYWKEKSFPIYERYLEDSGPSGQELFDLATETMLYE